MEFFTINNLDSDLQNHITSSYTSTPPPISSCPPCSSDDGGGGDNNPDGTDSNQNLIPDDESDSGGNNSIVSSNPVKINGVKFNKCESNNSKTNHCITDMYSYDDFGLPVRNNVSTTENNNILYRIDGNYVPNPKNELKKKKNCGKYGCCADGISKANDSIGSNCIGFSNESKLTGSPITNLQNNLLGNNQRRIPFDSSSGNSYMDYINPNLNTSNIIESFENNKYSTAHYIIKYVLFLCILIVNILIIIYYVKKNKKKF